MATVQYVRGVRSQITHVSAGAIAVDTIIPVDNSIAIAYNAAAAASENIQASITGEYIAPKAAGVAIAAGERVMWDSSESNFSNKDATPAAGDIMGAGVAIVGAASAATEVHIMLTPSAGVLS